MKFKYRLENILRYELLKESSKQMEIARSLRKMLNLKEQRSGCKKSILGLLGKPTREENAYCWVPFTSGKMSVDVEAIEDLKVKIEEQEDDLAQRQDELVRITQKKRALETLKEKRQQEFQKNQTRQEQKQLEDLYRNSRRSS